MNVNLQKVKNIIFTYIEQNDTIFTLQYFDFKHCSERIMVMDEKKNNYILYSCNV